MKNVDRQRRLDEEKWVESEKACADMSGQMPYCDFCREQSASFDCEMNPNERVSTCRCATAYNLMVSRGNKRK